MKLAATVMMVIVIALVSCTTAQYTSFGSAKYSMTEPDRVKVYMSTLPEEPYEEIGLVEIEGKRIDSSADLIDKLRRKAAENGAEGIIIQEMSESTRGAVFVSGTLLAVQKKIYRASAIRFTAR